VFSLSAREIERPLVDLKVFRLHAQASTDA
jgi:hypothetical protein